MRVDIKKSVVAIITARGGSKGLPGKNIKNLAGKPLIAYTIEAAKKCGLDVFVTTDDLEIASVSKKYGTDIIQRPAELSQDDSSSYDAVVHALKTLQAQEKNYNYFILLQPTSPLRTDTHIQQCLAQFLESGAKCAISVCEAEHSPYKAFKIKEKKLKPFMGAKYLDQPRQDLPVIYRQNGAIYVMKCSDLHKARGFYIEPAMPYIMTVRDSIDIDTLDDFESAEMQLKKRA